MKAKQIALTAAELIGGDRAKSHGDKLLNHEKIASVWNGILMAAGKGPLVPLNAHDVANLMEGLKIARRYSGTFNLDDYLDGCGYAAVAGEIAAKMDEAASESAPLKAAALGEGSLRAVVQHRPQHRPVARMKTIKFDQDGTRRQT